MLGRFGRRNPPPPTIGPDLVPGAVYILDTGVGLAFGSVHGGLDLLERHYGHQLHYAEDVLIEWRVQAGRTPEPPSPYCSPQDRDDHERVVRIKKIAAVLLGEIPRRFSAPVDLGEDGQQAVDLLIDELDALPPPRPRQGTSDRGECASVRLGELRRAHHEVIVLCCNDHRGYLLAYNHSIAHRNMVGVLREMARAGLVTAEEALEHYGTMSEVTSLPDKHKAVALEDFT